MDLNSTQLVSTMLSEKSGRSKQSEHHTAQEFETLFLSQFVDQMMKTVEATAFGGDKHAEMWRSFMSDAIAQNLTETGGLGLSASVEQALAAYTRNQPE